MQSNPHSVHHTLLKTSIPLKLRVSVHTMFALRTDNETCLMEITFKNDLHDTVESKHAFLGLILCLQGIPLYGMFEPEPT